MSVFGVGVLASGEGSNLQAVLDRVHGQAGISVVGVCSNLADAPALDRARRVSVEAAHFDKVAYSDRDQRDRAIAEWLVERGAKLAVLAGYMELVSHRFLQAFAAGVINVHPSLLPAFPGLHSVEQQLSYGTKVGGVTVHFVDDGVDSGPIILQEPVAIPTSRTVEATSEALHRVEHKLLPTAIELIAAGKVEKDAGDPRIVRILD